jgi:hypothetical protein
MSRNPAAPAYAAQDRTDRSPASGPAVNGVTSAPMQIGHGPNNEATMVATPVVISITRAGGA